MVPRTARATKTRRHPCPAIWSSYPSRLPLLTVRHISLGLRISGTRALPLRQNTILCIRALALGELGTCRGHKERPRGRRSRHIRACGVPVPLLPSYSRASWSVGAVRASFQFTARRGAQGSAWHRAGTQAASDTDKPEVANLDRSNRRSTRAQGWQADPWHTPSILGDTTGTGQKLVTMYEATAGQEQQGCRLPGRYWELEGGAGQGWGGRNAGRGESELHLPHESWCHAPLWFCKLQSRERKAERNQ